MSRSIGGYVSGKDAVDSPGIKSARISRMPKVSTWRVTPHVWCVQRTRYLSCSYLVTRESDVVLIDAGMDPTGEEMRVGLTEAGRSLDEVSAILLTHWHNDHSSGAAALQQESGARVFYHEAGHAKFSRADAANGWRGFLAARLPDAGPFGPLKGLIDSAPPRAVDAAHFVEDGEVVENDFEVLVTPGHDAGHVAFYYAPDRVLFAGDALAVVGDHVSFLSRFLTQDHQAAKQSMIRCLGLDLKALCPGHRYPLVDPDPAYLAAMREKVAAMSRFPIFGA